MIQLTVLVKRNPELSIDEFHDRWRAHGRMIAADPVFRRLMTRYEQHHRAVVDYRNGDTFDGMALQWYETYDDFRALLASDEYETKMAPDEAQLLDLEELVVIFTEPGEVFIP
ncbi:MAG TPA: EthD domain-containing protein [Acidimicrobiales bacterium]